MTMHQLQYEAPAPGERRARTLAAGLLHMASRGLGLLAQRVALRQPAAAAEHVVEFHGEAGAPEGALYVDGQLVGHVLGVTRL